MIDYELLLALGIFCWAGIWTAWLALAVNPTEYDPVVRFLVFIVLFFGWWIMLPLHVRVVEKRSTTSRQFVNEMQTLQQKFKEAQDNAHLKNDGEA